MYTKLSYRQAYHWLSIKCISLSPFLPQVDLKGQPGQLDPLGRYWAEFDPVLEPVPVPADQADLGGPAPAVAMLQLVEGEPEEFHQLAALLEPQELGVSLPQPVQLTPPEAPKAASPIIVSEDEEAPGPVSCETCIPNSVIAKLTIGFHSNVSHSRPFPSQVELSDQLGQLVPEEHSAPVGADGQRQWAEHRVPRVVLQRLEDPLLCSAQQLECSPVSHRMLNVIELLVIECSRFQAHHGLSLNCISFLLLYSTGATEPTAWSTGGSRYGLG